MNETIFESKLIDNQTGTLEQVVAEIYTMLYVETITASYSGLLEYLSNRIVNGQFGRIADKVPGSKSSETTSQTRIDGILTDVIVKQKSWAYAVVISPGSGCNPTGNEGCGDNSSNTGGTSDDDKPHPTGLQPRKNNDTLKRGDQRDFELMDRCCANTKKSLKH